MGDLWFIIRMSIFTILLVLLLQIRIGENTIEEKAHGWIKANPVLPLVQQVAEGAGLVVVDVYNKTFGNIRTSLDRKLNPENQPGSRSIGINLQRSKEFLQKQIEKFKADKEASTYIQEHKQARQQAINDLGKEVIKPPPAEWEESYQTPVWEE